MPCDVPACKQSNISCCEVAQSLHTPRDDFNNGAARQLVVVAHVDAGQPAIQGWLAI